MSSRRPRPAEPSRELLSRLGNLKPTSLAATAYRHLAPSRDPLSGEGARIHGGRWNPPESFPTIYLGLSEATVDAEFARMASKQGRHPDDFLPRDFVAIRVELAEVINLRSSVTQQELRLSVSDLTTDDLTMTQTLGAAAHALDFEGIVAPSATSIGDVLAVFPERIRISGVLEVVERRTL